MSDIWTAKEHTIVIPVNCVGVMGAGLAKQYAEKYSTHVNAYKIVCDNKRLAVGNPYYHFSSDNENEFSFIFFPTKNHWKDKSRLEDIKAGLGYIYNHPLLVSHMRSLAVPLLGAGLGCLNKDMVYEMIDGWAESLFMMKGVKCGIYCQ